MRNFHNTFFTARRRIAEAADKQAKLHHIDMKLVDYDTESEMDSFYNGAYSSGSAMKVSPRSPVRKPVGYFGNTSNYKSKPKPFYSKVNSTFVQKQFSLYEPM